MNTDAVGELELRGITKTFGSVTACDAVDLSLCKGEIHGLLGENGAGKSTLMKILLGLEQPDTGGIFLANKELTINTPHAARKHGIDMVHQHFSLVGPLRVWENVVLGDKGPVRKELACSQVEQVATNYGLPIDPLARVDRLSAGERQRVELIKTLRRDPSYLILDEPTSVLTTEESDELFAVLKNLVQREHRAIILISHKLAEITSATDRVTVLRRGKVVYENETTHTSHLDLARQMVGRNVSIETEASAMGGSQEAARDKRKELSNAESRRPTDYEPEESHSLGGQAALRIQGASVTSDGVRLLDSIDLEVYPGEIVGLYGVEGNGQSALGDVLAGLTVPDSGAIYVDDAEIALDYPDSLTRAGLGIIPENRHKTGVILPLSIAENLAFKTLDAVSGRVLLNRKKMVQRATRLMKEFNIVSPSPDIAVGNLSGGNQQRVVLAREMSNNPRVLVAAQPTQGLDIGAIEDMYIRLRKAAADGLAILLISTELDEIMALSSRIAVISAGRLTGIVNAAEVTTEQLGYMVGGGENG